MKGFSGLRIRFFFYYVILVILPVTIVTLFSIRTYNKATDSIEGIMLDYAISQAAGNLDTALSSYRNTMAKVVTDAEVTGLISLYAGSPGDHTSAAYVRNALNSRFSAYVQANGDITSLALLGAGDGTISYDKSAVRFDAGNKWSDEAFCRQLIERYHTSGGNQSAIWIMSGVGLERQPPGIDRYLYFVYPAIDLINGRQYGYLVMEVQNQVFNSILDIQIDRDMLDSYISAFSCLTDPGNTIVACPDRGMIGSDLSGFPQRKEPDEILHRSLPLHNTGLTLNLIYDKGAFQQYIHAFGNLIVLFMVVVTAVFIVLVFLLTGGLWNRVNRMAGAIRSFGQNQTDQETGIEESDQILYPIASQFHEMTARINGLVTELKEKNERIAFETNQRREAEIRALQAQINPHFLYNALDRINWIAIDNDQFEISSMLNGLGSLLRYSVSNIDVLVPLEAELQWMTKYIFIQNKRFETNIVLECDVDKAAASFPLYKMLLQPIVENSILHAFPSASGDDRIHLRARVRQDDRMEILLADNGKGIEPDTLRQLEALIDSRSECDADGIGMKNVVSRLWLYYGGEAEITVSSTPGSGAAFRMIIPYRP